MKNANKRVQKTLSSQCARCWLTNDAHCTLIFSFQSSAKQQMLASVLSKHSEMNWKKIQLQFVERKQKWMKSKTQMKNISIFLNENHFGLKKCFPRWWLLNCANKKQKQTNQIERKWIAIEVQITKKLFITQMQNDYCQKWNNADTHSTLYPSPFYPTPPRMAWISSSFDIDCIECVIFVHFSFD